MSSSVSNTSSPPAVLVAFPRDGICLPRLIGEISGLIAFLTIVASPLSPCFADPAKEIPAGTLQHVSPAASFVTVSRLGESEKETTLRDGKLLSHGRTADPFGITIRGPLKSPVPVVVEQPTASPVQATAVTPVTPVTAVSAAVNVPTLKKAVEGLTVGAVNLASHQILVGSESIREGDLLVLDSAGYQFTVWVQNVGPSGVWFCDTALQEHVLKPLGYGPKELPGKAVWEVSDLGSLPESAAKP